MLQINPTVLLVEDDEILAAIIEDSLTGKGYRVVAINDGEQAWALLRTPEARFDAILLDRELPGMGGLDLLRHIRASGRYDHVPVIMETSTDDARSMQEGLDAGAYYYLTKPFEPSVLIAVVTAAIQQFHGYLELQEDVESVSRSLTFLDNGHFRVRTVDDSRVLANALARLCPEPPKILLGLQELLVNAVEHGNLGITYDEKTELILSDRLHLEWDRRLALEENLHKFVEIDFERRPDALAFTIRDQGPGFEWEKYLDFDLDRMLDPNGKGIAMAKKNSFDHLEFQGTGNTVLAVVKLNG